MVLTKNNKIIYIILLLFVTLFSMYFFSIVSNAGSGSALQEGDSLWNEQSCVCAPTYTVVTPSRGADNKITPNEDTYQYINSDSNYCYYGNNIKVACNTLSGSTLMSKYVNANILTTAEAENFIRDASMYAAYVQEGLSTKTQQGLQTTNLGNGPFNRAMFEFNQNAHFVYSFMIGFAFVTSLLVFILIFIKITWLPDYPMQRRLAMEDIVTSGIATILLGGIWLIISLFQSIFDKFWSTYAIYSKDWRTVGNMFLYEYKGLITGILGIAALTALLMFIKNFASLSFSATNPNERRQKMLSLLLTGIATAGLGGLTIFVGFFWHILN